MQEDKPETKIKHLNEEEHVKTLPKEDLDNSSAISRDQPSVTENVEKQGVTKHGNSLRHGDSNQLFQFKELPNMHFRSTRFQGDASHVIAQSGLMNSTPEAPGCSHGRPFEGDVSHMLDPSYHMNSTPTASRIFHGEETTKYEDRLARQSLKKQKMILPTKSHSHSCVMDSSDYESTFSDMLSPLEEGGISHENFPSITRSPRSGSNSPPPLPGIFDGDHTETTCEKQGGSLCFANRDGGEEDDVEDEGVAATQKENHGSRSRTTHTRENNEQPVVQSPMTSYKQSATIVFNNNDVVCDRSGAITEDIVGNRRFCVLLDLYHDTYYKATSTAEKFGTAQKIRNAIRGALPSGRVIQLDKKTGDCSILKNDLAIKIIERALARKI